MHRFKRLYLFLCLLLAFSVGFLSVNSTVALAYGSTSGNLVNSWILRTSNGEVNMAVYQNNIYYGSYNSTVTSTSNVFNAPWSHKFTNPEVTDVNVIQIGNNTVRYDFELIPDLYDYYMVLNVFADDPERSFTFQPDQVYLRTYPCDTDKYEHWFLEDLSVYHSDDSNSTGFTAVGKIPDNIDNVYISRIFFKESERNKTIADGLVFQGLVVAMEKGSDMSALTALLQEIDNNTDALESQISQLQTTIQNTIEEQYAIDDSEDFGVQDIQDQVEDKMGVLNFGAETLTGFLDLFSPANAGDTSLTFPGFKMDIQGEEYQVWNDIEYDFTSLEEDFGLLIGAVRTVTVLSVWLAVLGYLVKAKDQFINNRG